MILSMSEQLYLFFIAFVLGFATGFVYDIIKTFRRIIKHNSFFVHLEDLLYWLIVTFALFYVLLVKNSGEVRGFCIIALLIGIGVYSIALSNTIVKLLTRIINCFLKMVMRIAKIILMPINKLLSALRKPFGVLKSRYRFVMNKLHICVRYAKIKLRLHFNSLRKK